LFAVRKVRDSLVGSDVSTKDYVDRSIASSLELLSDKVMETCSHMVKLYGILVMAGNSDMGRNTIRNVIDPLADNEVRTKG
jgi:hypothetical protein